MDLCPWTCYFYRSISQKFCRKKIVNQDHWGFPVFLVRFRTVMKNYDRERKTVEFLFFDPEMFKICSNYFNVRLVWGSLVSLRNWKSLMYIFVTEKKLSEVYNLIITSDTQLIFFFSDLVFISASKLFNKQVTFALNFHIVCFLEKQ